MRENGSHSWSVPGVCSFGLCFGYRHAIGTHATNEAGAVVLGFLLGVCLGGLYRDGARRWFAFLGQLNRRGQSSFDFLDELNRRGQSSFDFLDELMRRGQSSFDFLDELMRRGQSTFDLVG